MVGMTALGGGTEVAHKNSYKSGEVSIIVEPR